MVGDHLPGKPGKVKEVKVGRGSAKDMGTVGEIPGNLSGQRKWHTASRAVVLFQSIHRMWHPVSHGRPSVWFVSALHTAVFIVLGQLTDIMKLSYCLQSGHHNACLPSSVYILWHSRELSFI